jgi:type II secretory pathway component PulM
MIRLTKREKQGGIALTICILAWSLFAFVIEPAKERIATLQRVIPEKQAELSKLSAAAKEYAFLIDNGRDLRVKVASQSETFELLPFLESLVQASGLEKSIAKMQQRVVPLGTDYSQTVVEIELRSLSLAPLVEFLGKIESSDILVRIASLYINKSRTKNGLLDAVIEIQNPRLSQTKVTLK